MARQRKSGAQVPIPSESYGQGTQMAAIQQAGGGIGAPAPDQDRLARAANAPVGKLEGAFGPTQRPNEPITAGVGFGPGPGPANPPLDPELLLQAMYAISPHPDIARLLMSRL